MTIGERIKKRRKELGISVDEVAKKLNKNRATMYRYESDEIENMSINILEPLAHALNTTPAYLMGWELETKEIEETDCDLKEKKLLKSFNKLNESGKDKVISNAQDLTQIDKYTIYNKETKQIEDKPKKLSLKEQLDKLNEEQPIETIAAHNDHWDEPGEMEKMLRDIERIKQLKKG
jgi:transcriptional regulator with XRE-family HTH domain